MNKSNEPYQVGRALGTNALAIIHDGDTVFCLFPGQWNGCTEHPEHASKMCALLNADALLAELAKEVK